MIETILTNCPDCGSKLEKQVCRKCGKTVKYAKDPYVIDTKDINGEVIVKVESPEAIALFPLKGKIRVMHGDSKNGIILMFEGDGENAE